ncbi:hypothetical protein BRADI_1g77495v3 [Brachypodium distachyon]|uniref:F-box domain-containing protein n=1 Tax=Brachypodium distachyon TaxID=15368 RepID=A0A0Q3HM69_BRADI|nr:hypothetical protein BRADI_1g77495v3 [Brachypodium distachyon]
MDANDGICFPYDVLLDILRRVPGRALAASRLVCRSWRGMIDAHGLVLPHVFPREFPGIFATYYGFYPRSALFAPPARELRRRRRQFFWDDWHRVKQHCNGLFLLENRRWRGPEDWDSYVCNPATLRSARLPRPPTMPSTCGVEGMFLAFDPAVSRHHEVFYFPTQNIVQHELGSTRVRIEPEEPGMEHPFSPSLFEEDEPSEDDQESQRQEKPLLYVKEPWEVDLEQMLLPCLSEDEEEEHESAGSTSQSNMLAAEAPETECHSGVLMILHCSKRTYSMVQLPGHPYGDKDCHWNALPKRYILASCERGICYVVLKEFQLEVWELTGLAEDQLGWTLAHETNLKARNHTVNYLRKKQKKQPTMTCELVESDKDLITLFEVESIDESNDVDGDDSTEEYEEDNYDEAHAEEEEEQDNVDDTQSEEEDEKGNYDKAHAEEEEEQDCNEEDEQENYDEAHGEEQDTDEEDEQLRSGTGSEYSWNSDEHNFINFDKSAAGDEDIWGWGVTIVGFHPYKDVLLLKFSDTVVAYHLQTSRMQYLDYIYPRQFCQNARDVHGAFPYRPCYIDALLDRKTSLSS